MERVIFAIDNDNDLHVNAKFLRHVDTLRALGKIPEVIPCIGCWEGKLERSYMMLAKDFHHVSDYVKGQEAVLYVPGDVRQPCVLEYRGGMRIRLNQMREISFDEVRKYLGYTYVNGKYFVC